jgi:uncharacterized repeat protein (TIGR01451 family)
MLKRLTNRNWKVFGMAMFMVLSLLVSASAMACDAPPSCGSCSGEIQAEMLGAEDPKVCHKDRPDEWGCYEKLHAANVTITTAGFYSIDATSIFDSGDDQLNESYFLTVVNSDGSEQSPQTGNAGNYFVVEDAGGPASSSNEYAGVFWFDEGVNKVYLNHYSLIWDANPEFKNLPEDPWTESVAIHALCLTFIPPVEDEAVIGLDKNGPEYAQPGEEITYTLDWSVSKADVTGLVLTDSVPAKTTFVSATGDYTKNGDVITWDLGDVSKGESGTVELVVKIDSYTYDTDFIVNTARLDSNETSPVADTVETEMEAYCITVINKIDNIDPVEPGGEITYTIEYENIGDAICVGTGVILSEYFDERTSFVSASDDPHFVYPDQPDDMPNDLGDPDMLWQWEEVLPDGPHFMDVTVKVDGAVENGDVLTNEVCIWSENGGKVCTTEDTTVYVPPVPYYNVSINKSVDKTVAELNAELEYSLDWSVTGNKLAPNVVVSDELPLGVEFVSASDGGVYSTTTHAIVWNLGDINPDKSGTFDVNVTLAGDHPHEFELVNVASIESGAEYDEDSAITKVNNPPTHDVEIEKSVDYDEVYVGDNVTFTLDFAVTGNEQSTNLIVEDSLPVELEFVSASNGGVYVSTMHKIVWSLGDTQAGTSDTFTVVAKAIAIGDALNTAQIHDTEKSDQDTASVLITEKPYFEINIEKDGPAEAHPGEQITYTIDWEVVGNMDVNHVRIIDTLPNGVSVVNTDGYVSGNQIFWNFYNVSPHATGTIDVLVELDQTLSNGDQLVNHVEMQADGKTSEDTATTVVSGALYSVHIEKSVDKDEVLVGETLIYTIDWSVTGNVVAENVIITDTLPAEVEYVTASPAYSQAGPGRTLTWNLGDKAPGSSGTIEIVVKTIAEGAVVENVAVITSGSESDNDNAITAVLDYDVEISKTGPAEANPNDEITYTIEWSLNGSGTAPEVLVTDELPAGTTFVGASGVYSKTGNVITWEYSDVAPGATKTETITIKLSGVTVDDVVKNFVEITSRDKYDADCHSTLIVAVPYYSVSVEKDANKDEVLVGEYLTYTIDWEITGNTVAPNVIITDTLPAEVEFVSANPTYSQAGPGTTLTWNLGDKAPGSNGTITVSVRATEKPANQDSSIENTVVIVSGNESDNDSVTTFVRDYSVGITKTAQAEVNPGGDIVYTINWEIFGDAVAENTVVTDTLPANTTFLTASGNYTLVGGNKVVWNLGDLNPSETGSLGIAVLVDSSAQPGDTVFNDVEIVSGSRSNVDFAETLVVEAPHYSVSIEKGVDHDVILVGEQLEYTVSYEITGNTTAPSVVVTDTMPENSTLVSATGTYSQVGDVLTWNLGDLQPGDTGSFTIIVNVDRMPLNGTEMENVANIVSGSESDNDNALTEVQDYDLEISKTGPDTANPGDQITYTIEWTLNGTGTAPAVTVTDELPAGTTFVSASGAYSINNGIVSWEYSDVIPCTTETETLTVELSNVQVDETVVNTAVVTSRDKSDDDNHSTLIVAVPYFDLSIEKSANVDSVLIGGEIVYTIDWAVSGNTTATDVRIFDYLPEGVGVPTTTPAYDNIMTVMGTNHAVYALVWNMGDLNPGDSGTIEIVVEAETMPVTGNEYVNNAKIMSGTKEKEASATVVIEDYGVEITKDAPAEANPGDEITYTIDWILNGTGTAPVVNVVDTLPAGTTFVSASGVYSILNDEITWEYTDVAPGTTETITVTVELTNVIVDETVTNNVTIDSSDKHAEASATTLIIDGSYYNLSITKNATGKIKGGNNINYELNWSVTGNATATDVVIVDTLPAEVTFQSATGTYTYDSATGKITWNLGDINPDDQGSFEVVVSTSKGTADGTVAVNTATITSGSKSATDDASTTITKEVIITTCVTNCGGGGFTPRPKVVLEYDYPFAKQLGSQHVETIVVKNTGNVILTNGVLVVDFPEEYVKFISSTNAPYVYDAVNGTVSFSIPAIAVGGSETIVVTIEAIQVGDDVLTTVDFTSKEANGDTDGTEDIFEGETPNPNVSIEYIYPVEKTEGSEYTETITVTNTGEQELTNGVLRVDLPEDYIRFVSADLGGYTLDGTTQTIEWPVANLAVGGSFTINMVIEVVLSSDLAPQFSFSGVPTNVVYDSNEADSAKTGNENITCSTSCPEKPKTPVLIPPVVAPAATSTVEVCEVCSAGDVCTGCSWWIWLIIVILHILALFIYWFYVSKEEIKESDEGEYYIIKGNWAWLLPVFLILAIVFLILMFICQIAPWWVLLVILAAFFLALGFYQALLKKAEIKYSPLLPLLVTVAVLVVYLICHSWAWWVWLVLLVLYILTLASYYLVIVKIDNKSRNYWWLVPLFMTALNGALLMVLRLCQCPEIIN